MQASEAIPEFGIQRENEERRDGGCGIVFDPATQRYAVGKHVADGILRLFSGGVDAGEDVEEGVLREVREESGLHDFLYIEKIGEAMAHYYNALRKVNRVGHATFFLIILKSIDVIPTQLEEHEQFTLTWATPKELLENWETHGRGADHWVYFLKKSVARAIELGYDTTTKGF